MNTVRRIAKNTLILFIAQMVSMGLGFFYMMYTARYLGAEGFGVLSFALAFTAIFGVFSDLGLSTLTTREVARDKSLAGKYLGNIAVMKVVLVIITFSLITITINLLGYPEKTIEVVYLIALSIIFSAFTGMFNSIFQAFEKMEYQSIGGILSSVLMLAGVLIAIKLSFGVVGFASLYFIINAIVLGYSFVICSWKFLLPKMEFDWGFWKRTIKEALPFGLSVIFVAIFYWIDSVMLSLMKGDATVGWYNAAYRIVLILLFIPQIFNIAVFPIMSKFYITSPDFLKISYEKFLKYMIIVSIPIGVGITLLAPKIILLIFGAGYSNSIAALQILIWSSVFIFMSLPLASLLNSLNRQIAVTKITFMCVILNIVLNLILIPKYSLIGASIATVTTEILSLILCYIASLRIGYGIPIKELGSIIISVLIPSALMMAFIIKFSNLTLIALIPLSASLYVIVLYLLKGINEEDKNLVRGIFNLNRKAVTGVRYE